MDHVVDFLLAFENFPNWLPQVAILPSVKGGSLSKNPHKPLLLVDLDFPLHAVITINE